MQCCKSITEELFAGNLHAQFCGGLGYELRSHSTLSMGGNSCVYLSAKICLFPQKSVHLGKYEMNKSNEEQIMIPDGISTVFFIVTFKNTENTRERKA